MATTFKILKTKKFY